VLCVDLPPEEGARDLIPALRDQGVDSIYLVAPTSTKERVDKVAAVSSGFVYYVSRTGVTGERAALPAELVRDVKRLRKRIDLPIAVGFGISSPAHVAAVGEVADGVVVGSALVRLIEEKADDPGLPSLLEQRVRELSEPLRRKAERRRA
jgi:tryptophan synthase alpha chain